jgi:hypothetical protein
LAEEITLAMKIGVLDLLCIIPQDEIREFGIPYVRSIIEKYLSRADIVKWDTFWGTYFEGQWMPILDSWNICTQDGTYKKFLNRTNNGLESYNKRFNGLFPKHNPSLIEFVDIVEKESRSTLISWMIFVKVGKINQRTKKKQFHWFRRNILTSRIKK